MVRSSIRIIITFILIGALAAKLVLNGIQMMGYGIGGLMGMRNGWLCFLLAWVVSCVCDALRRRSGEILHGGVDDGSSFAPTCNA